MMKVVVIEGRGSFVKACADLGKETPREVDMEKLIEQKSDSRLCGKDDGRVRPEGK